MGKDLNGAWKHELTHAQRATVKSFDMRSRKTVSDVASALHCGHFGIHQRPAAHAGDVAQQILKLAVESNTPLFVHFDEVGALGENVRDLRDAEQ